MSDLSKSNPSNSRHIVWDVAVLLLPLVGLAQMLLLQAVHLYAKPETILLPIFWLSLAVLAYRERKSMANTRGRVLLSYLAILVALVIGIASVLYFSPWAANLAMAFVFIGWAMVRLAPTSITRILALSTLVLVSLSLPFGLEAKLAAWTNSAVVHLCSSVLDVFRVYHLYQSPYLAFKDHYFEIAELLGNVFSLQSMVAIAILVSLIWQRPFLTFLFNILSTLVWTLLGKILFLFTVAVCSFNGINLQESMMGNLTLGAIFMGFFFLVLATDAFWNAVLSPIRSGDEGIYRSSTANVFNSLVSWPGKLEFQDRAGRMARPTRLEPTLNPQPSIAVAFGCLMLLLTIPSAMAIVKNDLLLNRANVVDIPSERVPDAKSLPEDFIPKQRQRQFRMIASSGLFAGTAKTLFWSYGGSGVETTFVLRIPVRGWMPQGFNYFQGSKLIESKMVNDASNWPWSESVYEGENGSSGLFFTCQLHTKGEPYVPTEDELTAANDLKPDGNRLFQPRILELLNPKQETIRPQAFLIQMRFQSETSIRPNEKQMLLEKFLEARKSLTSRLLGIPTGATK